MNRRSLLGLSVMLFTGCRIKGDEWPPYPEKIVNGVHTSNGYDTNRWEVKMRRVLAKRIPPTGFSTCASCGLPWWCVQGHSVPYDRAVSSLSDNYSQACFPVCESCKHNLNPDEILPFYERWVREAYPDNPDYVQNVKHNLYTTWGGWG